MRLPRSFLLLLLLLLSVLDGIHCASPSVLFAFANDPNNTLREYLYSTCSPVHPSLLFLCSDGLIYYVRFHFSLSLAPFQTQSNQCGLILHYQSFQLDHLTKFSRRSLLSIDVSRSSRVIVVVVLDERSTSFDDPLDAHDTEVEANHSNDLFCVHRVTFGIARYSSPSSMASNEGTTV